LAAAQQHSLMVRSCTPTTEYKSSQSDVVRSPSAFLALVCSAMLREIMERNNACQYLSKQNTIAKTESNRRTQIIRTRAHSRSALPPFHLSLRSREKLISRCAKRCIFQRTPLPLNPSSRTLSLARATSTSFAVQQTGVNEIFGLQDSPPKKTNQSC